MWTIKSVLKWTKDYFAGAGIDSPQVDAEILLASVLNCNRIKLYLDQDEPLTENELNRMHNYIARRVKHEPIAYILGKRGFMQDDFIVTPAVLIPRPETELLVERCATLLKSAESPTILEIGTGSGALILSLLKLLPAATAKACDISSDALAIAWQNAIALGLSDRVKFLKTDICNGLDTQQFDMIVSNPPYIPCGDLPSLDKDVQFEPQLALNGGTDGLDFYRKITTQARLHLTSEGIIAFEIGINQGQNVAELCRQNNFDTIKILKDYAGIERNVFATGKDSRFADKILELKN